MTKNDYYSLSGDIRDLYEFYLYYEERPLIGHMIQTNHTKEEYRVLTNPDLIQHRDKQIPYEELGTAVRLESITKWNLYSPSRGRSSNLFFGQEKAPKKMVIFGAGASYDFIHGSIKEKHRKPPLTMDLFADHYDDLLREFGPARNLSSEIIVHNGGIEDYFQKQWIRMENNTDKLLFRKLLNTQYYIYSLFRKVSQRHFAERKNNYNIISKWAHEYAETANEQVLFVTFNYDVLLDWAIEGTCDYTYEKMDDYIDMKKKKILLFKPHGSCNWGRRFSSGFPLEESMKKRLYTLSLFADHLYKQQFDMPAIKEHLEDEIILHHVPTAESTINIAPDELVFPHLLLPYKDKDAFAMPNDHTNLLGMLLPSIEEILIVGWKGNEMEFQKLLQRNIGDKKIKITVVTESSEDIRENYKEVFPKMEVEDWTFHKGGFTKYIAKGNQFF